MTLGIPRLSLSLGSTGVGAPPVITTSVNHATALFVGEDAASDVANIADLTNTASYTAISPATIVSAVYQVNASTVATNTTLADGDYASILVTDSDGATRRFPIDSNVTYVAPVAGSLAAVNETQGGGAVVVNLSAGFTGSNLTFTSNQPWATVSGSNLTIADEVRTGTVTITAANSGGSATVDLSVTIAAPVVSVTSAIADQSFAQNSGDVTIDLDTVFTNATSYSVTGPSASVSGSILTLDDATLRSGVTITVTGTNGFNSADDVFLLSVVEFVETRYVGTVVTTTSDEAVTFPMRDTGTYNATLDPGDGSSVVTGLTTFDAAGWTHTYATPGTHTFIIDGDKGAPHWYSSATDRAKLRTITNLGEWNGADHRNAFRDTGLTSFVAGNSDVSSATLMTGYIQDCSSLVEPNLSGMDVSSVTNFRTFADSCASLTGILGLETWTPTAGEQFDEFAWDCPSLDATTLRIGTWSTPDLLPESGSFLGFFNFIPNNKALSATEYAAFLQTQNALSLTGGDFWYGFGTSPVSAGAATTARTDMITNKSRFFTDGATAVPNQMAAPSLSVSGTVVTSNLAEGTFNNGLPVTREDIRYSTDESTWTEVLDVTEPVDTDVSTASQQFYFQARANNFRGNGAWSASATITTDAVATISVENASGDPVANVPLNDEPFVYLGYSQRANDSATLTTNMIAANPTFVSNPAPTGNTGLGDVVTFPVPVLLYAGEDLGDSTFQIYRDAVLIPGAESNLYTVTATDQDTDLTMVTNHLGQTINSPAIAIPAAASAPSAFVDANWSVATGSSPNELDITIASLPSNGGSAITDIEYDIGASGTWVSLGTATTGTETVTMAAPATSYAIRLRAVNGAGNGAAGNSESATSGAASFNGWASDPLTSDAWDGDASTITTTTGTTVDEVLNVVGSLALPAIGAPQTGRIINGRNAIDMPNGGGNAYLRIFDTLVLPAQTFTLHYATIIDSVGGSSEAVLGMKMGSSELNIRSNSASQFDGRIELQNTGSTTAVNFTGGPYSGFNVFSLVFDLPNNLFTVYVNGTSAASGNYTGFNTLTAGRLRLGAQDSGGNTLDSAFLTVALTEATNNKDSWVGWLTDRWVP